MKNARKYLNLAGKSKAPKIDMNYIPALSKDIMARENFDNTVVVMLLEDRSHFYKINGVAGRIWLKINGKRTVLQLINKVAEDLDVEPQTLKAPTLKFIRDCTRAKFLGN